MRSGSPDQTPQLDRRFDEVYDELHAAAASTMRRILVDHARRRGAVRRGDGARRVTLSIDSGRSTPPLDFEVVDLHQALLDFAAEDERAARVVELRFFGGMTTEEAARVLEVSPAAVKRDWAFAKAWLLRRLEIDEPRSDGGH